MIGKDAMSEAVGGTFPRQGVDTLPVPEADADCLDLEKVATHIAQAQARGRYSGPTEPEAYLR